MGRGLPRFPLAARGAGRLTLVVSFLEADEHGGGVGS